MFCAIISLRAQTSVEIDLQEQTAYLIRNGRVVLSTPVSTGRYGHLTGNGAFKVIEKELNHFSNMYGKIVDARGNTIVPDADADVPVPRGGKFIPAPMRYFMLWPDPSRPLFRTIAIRNVQRTQSVCGSTVRSVLR